MPPTVPGASLGQMGDAYGAAEEELAGPAEEGVDETTEIEERIMRLEDKLIERGVLSEGDLAPAPDPAMDPAAAEGLPPEAGAPQGAAPAPGAPTLPPA